MRTSDNCDLSSFRTYRQAQVKYTFPNCFRYITKFITYVYSPFQAEKRPTKLTEYAEKNRLITSSKCTSQLLGVKKCM